MLDHELNKPYDAIFSLGGNCQVAYQLRRRQLRPYAGPLDWFVSPACESVTKLVVSGFNDFMQLERLETLRPLQTCYAVRDTSTGITSYHDFLLHSEHPDEPLASYPKFRAKLDRRISRFYDRLNHASSVLCIRLGATEAEAEALLSALQSAACAPVTLLAVRETDTLQLRHLRTDRSSLVMAELPKGRFWYGSNEGWDQLLAGVSLIRPSTSAD